MKKSRFTNEQIELADLDSRMIFAQMAVVTYNERLRR